MSKRIPRPTNRRLTRPGPRTWASVAIVGTAAVAAAYLLDPERGRGRRIRAAGRIGHVVRHSIKRLERQLRYAQTAARGRIAHRFADQTSEPLAHGNTLLDRVESELFTDRSIPHGRISLEVEGTAVVVRGELDTRAEIERVEDAVG